MWVILAPNAASIEKGNDTKVSDLKSLVVQKQESKYSKAKKTRLILPNIIRFKRLYEKGFTNVDLKIRTKAKWSLLHV